MNKSNQSLLMAEVVAVHSMIESMCLPDAVDVEPLPIPAGRACYDPASAGLLFVRMARLAALDHQAARARLGLPGHPQRS